MPEPKSLYQLALDSLVCSVCSLCYKLTDCKRRKRNNTEVKTTEASAASLQTAKDTCKLFRMLFLEKIPPLLSNEVSNMLLTTVDDWWGFNRKYLKFKDCRDILQEIVNSIILPKVKRIGALRNTLDCSDLFTSCEFRSEIIVPLLQPLLPSLTNLKALHVRSRGNMFVKDIYVPEQLEEFSGYPDDELLNRIITKCPGIRFLNVSNSKRITNESVETILKLDQLEKLNIEGTEITLIGITELLSGLSKKQTLKELCMPFNITKEMLEIIYTLIPNVTLSLSSILNYEAFNYEHFDPKNMRALRMKATVNGSVKLMQVIGNHLIFLAIGNLVFDNNEAVKSLINAAVCLTSLKCFHLTYTVSVRDCYHQDFEPPLKEAFQSVTCFKVRSYRQLSCNVTNQHILGHLLYQCVNVESLSLDWNLCFRHKQRFLETLCKKYPNVLKRVKEIYWVTDHYMCQDDDSETAQFLIEKFLSLEVVAGLCVKRNSQFPESHRVKFLS